MAGKKVEPSGNTRVHEPGPMRAFALSEEDGATRRYNEVVETGQHRGEAQRSGKQQGGKAR